MQQMPTTQPGRLADALRGVRAVIFDADGVLLMKARPLPGALDAVRAVADAGIPFRIATNFSSIHRSNLAKAFVAAGFPVTAEQFVTSGSATAAYTRRAHAGQPLFVINRPDGLREFEGQRLLSADEADAPEARAAAVVLGDGAEAFSFENMNRAFRLAQRGAELVACHRSPWWHTDAGPTLDVGSFMAALEHALGRRARVCGKPGPVMFRTAFAGLATEAQGLAHHDVLMIGDDARSDVGGARRLGMRAALVLSGRTTAEAAAALLARPTPSKETPDGVAPAVGDVVAALLASR